MERATRRGRKLWRKWQSRLNRNRMHARLEAATGSAQRWFEPLEDRLLMANTFTDVTSTAFAGLGYLAAAWGDIDNDGDTDAITTGGQVYRNNGSGTFTATGGNVGGGSNALGDFNNDGFIDTVNSNGSSVGAIYINNGGNGTFTAVGLPSMPSVAAQSVTLGDYNDDGYLDIFVPGFEDWPNAYYTDYVYLSTNTPGPNGTRTYTLVSQANGGTRPGRGSTSFDWNRDGDLDVYVSNYRLEPNHLWSNSGAGGTSWLFTDIASSVGATAGSGHSIGANIADYNSDGWLDIFAGNFAHSGQPESRLLRNNSGTSFTDLGPSGVPYQEAYASPVSADFNNDGYPDMFFTALNTGGYSSNGMLFLNNGNMTFSNVTSTWGLPTNLGGYDASWADIDADGDMDLNVAGKMYRNNLTNSNKWLEVTLKGINKPYDGAAVGAQVRVTAGSLTVTRQVEAGTGQGNQNDVRMHFGLGNVTGPVTVQIMWPNGTTETFSTDVNKRLNIGLGTPLPYTEDFNDGVANYWQAVTGTWVITSGRYRAKSSGNRPVSRLNLQDSLPSSFGFDATLRGISGGTNQNAYFVFDYVDDTNFKVAGANISGGSAWKISSRVNGVFTDLATLSEPLAINTDYAAQFLVEGKTVRLVVGGVEKLNYTFTDTINDGSIGLGTRNAWAEFDNVNVHEIIPPPPAPVHELFNVDAGQFQAIAGTWSVNASGRYDAAPASGKALALLPALNNAPAALRVDATLRTKSGGTRRDAVIIFDYQSPTDFKFAGAYAGAGKWRMGHSDGTTWTFDNETAQTLADNVNYNVDLLLNGNVATLSYNGVVRASFNFGSSVTDGRVGVGTQDSLAEFDNFGYAAPLGLPYSEDLTDGDADSVQPWLGTWSVIGGTYQGTANAGTGNAAVSAIQLSGPLPSTTSIQARVRGKAGGLMDNALVIFDYKSPTDFKYAGVVFDADMWQIGKLVGTTWTTLASSAVEPLNVETDYNVQVVLESGGMARLLVGGVQKVSYNFGSAVNIGEVGLGTRESIATFDNIVVGTPPVSGATLPYIEDFNDGTADFLSATAGTWSVNSNLYKVNTVTNGYALSILSTANPLPANVSIQAVVQGKSGLSQTNSFIIFDYVDPSNFKFARASYSSDVWQICHVTNGTIVVDASSLSEVLNLDTNYSVQVRLQGSLVTLASGGVDKVSFNFGTAVTTGKVGLGTRNAISWFDDLNITEIV